MLNLNSVYCGDCAEVMQQIDSCSIDLTITSPPYDNLRVYNGYVFDFHVIAAHLYRVSKQGGVVVWIVKDSIVRGSETGTAFRQALYFKDIGFNLHNTMIYLKDNPPPTGGSNRYYQYFEYMFVFSKGSPKTFNPIKEPRRNKWNDKRTSRIKAFTRNKKGEFEKKRITFNETVKIGNVWKFVVGGGNSVPNGIKHPAVFPEKLAEQHILSWSNEGDLVLDPMCGSGTSLIAASRLNRNYIGIDISEEYCKLSEQRVDTRLQRTK